MTYLTRIAFVILVFGATSHASCMIGGKVVAPGYRFTPDGGCGVCECTHVGVIHCSPCTVSDSSTCNYHGHVYEKGDNFPASDGCNTCFCDTDGMVGCTEMYCGVGRK